MNTNAGSLGFENGLYRFSHEILPVISQDIADVLKRIDLSRLEQLEEIRLRADKPLMLLNYKSEWFVRNDGSLDSNPYNAFNVTQKAITRSLELMSSNSVYAFQEEISNGYITIKGGHRVGITGRVVYDGSCVKNLKDISGLNVRLSSQILGCAGKLMKYILNGKSGVYNTLLVSPPQCGKTTLLRDIARYLSNGMPEFGLKGIKIGIVDERSEIAACFRGIPQNDVGIRTDVLDGCLKSLGMTMMIRSMSPDVIITDEIGSEGDREAINSAVNAGVKIITSAHGYNISELKSRREVLMLLEEKIFERFIVLGKNSGPGTVVEIIDGITMKQVAGEGYHVA